MPELQPKKKVMKAWERLVIAGIVLGLGVVLLVWLMIFQSLYKLGTASGNKNVEYPGERKHLRLPSGGPRL